MARTRFHSAVARLLLALAILLAAAALPTLVRPAAALDDLGIDAAVAATVQVGVLLEAADGRRIWSGIGSGAVVAADGLVLTNHHVIDEASIREELAERDVADLAFVPDAFAIATSDGRTPPELRFVASVAADDPALDLAVLRIDRDAVGQPLDPAGLALPTLPLGSVAALDLGDPLNLFGYPAIGGDTLTYTRGIVAGFGFESGVDGPAWIKTDAVMSGGNSGGAAVDESGRLVGVPTRGSQLDCRPAAAESNAPGDPTSPADPTDPADPSEPADRTDPADPDDGSEAVAADNGCVPTGGALGEIRPIDVAMPLLRSIAPDLAAPDGARTAPAPVAAADAGGAQAAPVDPANARATADACAARGDWRCAVRSFEAARAALPDDPALAAATYDALLGLGGLEEDAGQLGAARVAYDRAQALDQARPEGPVALTRIAPYAAILAADGFAGQPNYAVTEDPAADSAAVYADGRLRMTVRAPGVISTFPLAAAGRSETGWAVAADITEASGAGSVVLSLDGAEGPWLLAADPDASTWSVLAPEAAGGAFVERVAATDYAGIAGQPLNRLEVRVVDDAPVVFVNGVDVSTPLGVALPPTGIDAALGFGASMDPAATEPFTASFDRVSVYALP
jgi:hypothetical protein